MQHLSEFIPLAVATLNLITALTALIAQRAARRRRERQDRGDSNARDSSAQDESRGQ